MKKSLLLIAFMAIAQLVIAQQTTHTRATMLSPQGGGTGEYIQNTKQNAADPYGVSIVSGGQNRMTFLTDGNIGVGTITPSDKFTIYGNGYGLLHTNGTQNVGTYVNSSGGWLGTKSNHPLHFFFNDGTPSMTLSTSGNFGIGTTSPKQKLHVNGDYYGKGHIWLHAFAGDGTSGTAYVQARDNSGSSNIDFQFRTQNAGQVVDVLKMATNGYVGIGTTTPSAALDINGQIKIRGGVPAAGKVLTSDANGLATWTTPTSSSKWATTGTNIHYNSGNVGIGTSSPSSALAVAANASNNRVLKVVSTTNTAGDQWWMGFNHGGTSTDANDRARIGVNIATGGAGRLFFTTGLNGGTQVERMRIDENGNVGIGYASPSVKLHVRGVVRSTNDTDAGKYVEINHGGANAYINSVGNGNLDFRRNNLNLMSLTDVGNVGVGTSTPGLKLDIRGDNSAIGLANTATWDHLYFNHDAVTAYMRAGGAEGGLAFQVGTGTTGSYGEQTYTEELRINNNGQVGIGGVLPERFEPNCALTVNGHTYIGDFGAGYNNAFINDSLFQDYYLWVERGVVSEDFAIDSVHYWDDYVFSADYDLPSVQHLEEFVKTNKHLPNVPSEAHVKKYGYTMHNMNRAFLKTMEEFALYIINQENQISTQQQKLNEQAAHIKTLQAQQEQLAKDVEMLKAALVNLQNQER